jgi:hypothetical protein
MYTTYFQGETVLVAYEFNVTDTGVYTLGAIGGPMQIVYFSADGVASLGRDGTGGAALEGIDFVYDTVGYTYYIESDTEKVVGADKIVTVNNAPEEGDDTEDYKYYYESGCLLYFDNETLNNNDYVNIYHEKIYIQRSINMALTTVQKTELTLKVTEGSELSSLEANRYVKLEDHAPKHDTINVKQYDVTNPNES